MQFAPVYPYLYRVLKPTFPSCLWSGLLHQKTIALTFDDGPHPQHTLPLLEVLDRYQVTASFFWLGVCVERSPQIARRIWQQGHWVGLHGYNHRSFPRLTMAELEQDLQRTREAIAQACQFDPAEAPQRIRDVRPPNGFFTPKILSALQQWDYRPVMWSVVPEDWVRPGVDITVQRVLEQTQNGSLIVLHDGYTGGEDVAAIANQLIPRLLDQGYEFVTVDQLWQQ
ncbi:MAG: polysaccharide deacetylase family protein [Oculatellaceae cyanobacterium Prado106]|jgi:peptidoglycan/xylan/chitin deacetylase (PgdA/CDA1 family)|nr:polysaccharide deacetylase family protein [Oculatellaceae cyanobacterium Prado106]